MNIDKQIDCNSVKERIVLGEKLNADEELHLLDCKDCQAFSHAHYLLMGRGESPSAKLDIRVKKAFMDAQTHPSPLRLWKRILPAAAAGIVLVGCLVYVFSFRLNAVKEITAAKPASQQSVILEETELSSWELEYALAEQELDNLEIAINELVLSTQGDKLNSDTNIERVRELDYELISLEMDMFYEL